MSKVKVITTDFDGVEIPDLTEVEDIQLNGKIIETKTDKDTTKLVYISASSLMKTEFDPQKYIVDGFIYTGVTILGSEPKYGKTVYAYELAVSVAKGEDFLGRKTHKCSVAYFDLESTPERAQTRLSLMGVQAESVDNLYLFFDGLKPLGDGFEEQIKGLIADKPDIELIVIDTFSKILPSDNYSASTQYKVE